MTWKIDVQTTRESFRWEVTADTANAFRLALNALGRAHGVRYQDVLAVEFRRLP